jgi:uncharacterized membrane protein
MAAVLRIIASLLAILISPIVSILSAHIAMGRDFSQEDTVGVITHGGFPIPFSDAAPGYSVVDGYNFARFYENTAVWAIVLFIAVQLCWIALKRHRSNVSAAAS